MGKNTLRIAILNTILLMGGTLTYSQTAYAQEQMQVYRIEAGDLESVLSRFGTQSRIQLIYPPDLLKGKHSNGLTGDYTPTEALRRLLEGSGLEAERVNDSTVVIKRVTVPAREPQAAAKNDPATPQSAEPPVHELDTLTVTGTRIRQAADAVVPLASFSREDIERTGAATVQDLLDALPQNFAEMGADGVYAREGGSALAQMNNLGRISGVDLRGLGPQSTLTLINGQRRAASLGGRVVDVSAIPVSVIDRIDVVTGGRSAIYGSDAVAGVVNIVTRRDFIGSESQVHYGTPTQYGGGQRLQASHILGASGERSGFVAAYDYLNTESLNIVDTNLVVPVVPVTGYRPIRIDGQSDLSRNTLFFSGRHDFSDAVMLHADAMYTARDVESLSVRRAPGAEGDTYQRDESDSKHLSAVIGISAEIGKGWGLAVDGARSSVNEKGFATSVSDFGFGAPIESRSGQEDRLQMTTLTAVANGPIQIGEGTPHHVAVGIEVRGEDYRSDTRIIGQGGFIEDVSVDGNERVVRSAFAEALIPLIDSGPDRTGNLLELSLAGRYDHYEDFGSTFNPQGSLSWRPTPRILIQGNYSTAFRAPSLSDIGGRTYGILLEVPDPEAAGTTPLLMRVGDNPELGPEEANTWSLGVSYEPSFISGSVVSLSYFNVSYKDRLDTPVSTMLFEALMRAPEFPGLIQRGLVQSDIDDIVSGFIIPIVNGTATPYDQGSQRLLDVFPSLVVFDNRTQNISSQEFEGIDFQFRRSLESDAGLAMFGFNGTYTLKHRRRMSDLGEVVEMVNQVGKPVGFRFRADLGWEAGHYGAYLYANYSDSYRNQFMLDRPYIGSWTTYDLTLKLDRSAARNDGIQQGWSFFLSIDNLFDRQPPEFFGGTEGIRYDVSNANPIGRYSSLRIIRRW